MNEAESYHQCCKNQRAASAYDPSTWEWKQEDQVQTHSQMLSEAETVLGYMRPLSQKEKKKRFIGKQCVNRFLKSCRSLSTHPFLYFLILLEMYLLTLAFPGLKNQRLGQP